LQLKAVAFIAIATCLGLLAATLAAGATTATQTGITSLIPAGASWRYWDQPVDPPSTWTTTSDAPAEFKTGISPFGYGNGGEATVINRLHPVHVSDYFRRKVSIADISRVRDVKVNLVADDGALVFVNGVEAVRDNMSTTTMYPVRAREADSGELTVRSFTVAPSLFRNGTNIVAVRLAQRSISDTDSRFDLTMSATVSATTTSTSTSTTTTTAAPTTTTVAPTTTSTTVAPTTTTTSTTVVPAATTTTTTTVVPAAGPAPSPTGFVHPGILVDANQLAMVRAKIAAGEEPWKSAFASLQNTGSSTKTAARPTSYRYSSLSYVPAPVAVIQAPSSGNLTYIAAHPELGLAAIGDVSHLDDARAAYAQALMWAFTGDPAYAAKSIQIMNAWSHTLTGILFDQPRRIDNNAPVYSNGKLQAGWGAELFARAAEIIRYTSTSWSATDVAQFGHMLDTVYLPLTKSGWSGGANWLATLADATIEIGVFNNNRTTFDAGVAQWRAYTPTVIYMPSDGATPIAPSSAYNGSAINGYWYNPTQYLPGLEGETLRDISHMMLGMGSISSAAETARIQGVDLFGEQKDRIVAGYELNAGYVNQYLDQVAALGKPDANWKPQGWPGSTFSVGGTAFGQGWEVAFNELAKRRGISMPNTAKLVLRLRPSGTGMQNSWETLTNALTP
jgi:hypothetical protein